MSSWLLLELGPMVGRQRGSSGYESTRARRVTIILRPVCSLCVYTVYLWKQEHYFRKFSSLEIYGAFLLVVMSSVGRGGGGGGGWQGVGDFWSSRIFFASNLVGRIFFPFFPMSFLLHLCSMQFFYSGKHLQDFFFKINHPPPPQELTGRPLNRLISYTLFLLSAVLNVVEEV